jgi:predicted secreted hydrolase
MWLRLTIFVVFLAGQAPSQDTLFRPALPGYQFEFPRDHFSHPEFKTEWWCYTGNLRAADGAAFGFELAFFREAVPNPYGNPSRWRMEQLYIAHLAVTDLRDDRFAYAQRMRRGALDLAGATAVSGYQPGRAAEESQSAIRNPQSAVRVWIGDWSASIAAQGHRLNAPANNIAVRLDLLPLKPPVVHGRDGASPTGPGVGNASHYYSFTRLRATGTIRSQGRDYAVTGLAWMDHEFTSSVLGPMQRGWDWFYLQFDDGSELMLYQLRRPDGSTDPYSAGAYQPPEGPPLTLEPAQFRLHPHPGSTWESLRSGGRYPLLWQLQIPVLEIELDVAAAMRKQELITDETAGVTYWEGAARATGQKGGQTTAASGYLEMSGYAPSRARPR